jgi:hypothetical protein
MNLLFGIMDYRETTNGNRGAPGAYIIAKLNSKDVFRFMTANTEGKWNFPGERPDRY